MAVKGLAAGATPPSPNNVFFCFFNLIIKNTAAARAPLYPAQTTSASCVFSVYLCELWLQQPQGSMFSLHFDTAAVHVRVLSVDIRMP